MIAVLDGRRSILRSHGLTRGAALVVLTVLLGWMVSSTLPGLGHAYPFWPSAGIAVALSAALRAQGGRAAFVAADYRVNAAASSEPY